MPSTPTISCSSGAETVSATTFGLAPGYYAVTITDGGTTSGYSLTGRLNSAMAPTMVMNAERTAAKIGRSIKKCESFTALLRRYTPLRVHHVRPLMRAVEPSPRVEV